VACVYLEVAGGSTRAWGKEEDTEPSVPCMVSGKGEEVQSDSVAGTAAPEEAAGVASAVAYEVEESNHKDFHMPWSECVDIPLHPLVTEVPMLASCFADMDTARRGDTEGCTADVAGQEEGKGTCIAEHSWGSEFGQEFGQGRKAQRPAVVRKERHM
jgi:hypothetical protein